MVDFFIKSGSGCSKKLKNLDLEGSCSVSGLKIAQRQKVKSPQRNLYLDFDLDKNAL